jgi:hypothetical protein
LLVPYPYGRFLPDWLVVSWVARKCSRVKIGTWRHYFDMRVALNVSVGEKDVPVSGLGKRCGIRSAVKYRLGEVENTNRKQLILLQ